MGFRIPVTIDHTKVGGDLTNYPVYIDLSTFDSDFWTVVVNGGPDIRITTSDGATQCPREVVSCDTSAMTGEVHTLLPAVSSSVDTIFYLYFGGGMQSDYLPDAAYGSQNVWGVNAKLVAHMKGSAADSSANINIPSIVGGTNLTTDRFSRANSAYAFDGVNGQINYSKDADATTVFCIKGWVLFNQAGVTNMGPYKQSNGNSLYPRMNISSSRIPLSQYRIDGVTRSTSTGAAKTNATWYHFAAQIDVASGGILYWNGVSYGTNASTGASIDGGSSTFFIGGLVDVASIFFNGSLSDISLWNKVFSANDLLTEYNNQSSPSTFYSEGSAEPSTLFDVIISPFPSHFRVAG